MKALVIMAVGLLETGSRAKGAVPLESNFCNAALGGDNNDYINPATGMHEHGAGAHGGIDIHNNFFCSSS